MDKLNGKSKDKIKENIEKLKSIFPEIVTEGYIDFEKLKETLGSYIDNKEERYNFTWNGKSNAKRIAQTPTIGTLNPCKEESVNWDSTENLFIEGDNLEVLKLLQKSYHKKIKMIYVDPPYNTGNDFIYNDDYRNNFKNYLEITGQLDEEGRKLTVNPETSGRYHTNWLNMMYPRLKLARNLLKDDGVIFISIDDNEIHNLRKICDEIFGEENFLACPVRRRRKSQANLSKNMSTIHEYLLCYSKSEVEVLNKLKIEFDESKFSNRDNDPRGLYVTMPCTNKGGSEYSIKTPTGKEIYEEWRFKKETYYKLLNEDKIVFPNGGKGKPRYKIFLSEKIEQGVIPNSWWDNVSSNQEATIEIKRLFNGKLVFENPKPIGLLKLILEIGSNPDDIILDFFPGSCTTAHAIIEVNKSNNKNLKFIMIQLPEICNENSIAFKAGYKTIADIGKERIRRVIKKIKSEQQEQNKKSKAKLFDENEKENKKELDLGFKVFKLNSSNIKTWDTDIDDIEQNLLDSVDNIKSDRSTEDVLYEILLKYGLDLIVPIEEINIDGKKLHSIGYGALVICLEKDISEEMIKGIIELKNELKPETIRVVFSDSSFKDDSMKMNAIENLKQNGIDDIKSL